MVDPLGQDFTHLEDAERNPVAALTLLLDPIKLLFKRLGLRLPETS